MEELKKTGLVLKNPEVRWGSAPRVVPKKDGTLRMTVDLRAVNEVTEPRAWPMPHQEAEMADLEGSTCFFSVMVSNNSGKKTSPKILGNYCQLSRQREFIPPQES
jgi:hypothetical protein